MNPPVVSGGRRTLADSAWLALATTLLLIPSLGQGLLCDDWQWLQVVRRVQHPARHFTRALWDAYMPLFTLSFSLDDRLWGLWGPGWHVSSGLLYVATGPVIYLLALQAGLGRRAALLAAAAFLSYPAHDEVVFWLCSRAHLLVTLFIGLCLVAHGHGVTRGSPLWRLVGVVAAGLAFLCKEYALLLPLLLPLYELLVLDMGWRRWPAALGRAVPAALLAAAYLLARGSLGLQHDRISQLIQVRPTPERLLPYLAELALPVPFTLLSQERALGWGTPVGIVVVIAATTVLAFAAWRERRIAARMLFAFVLAALPIVMILTATLSFRRRYLYLPSVGYALLVGLAADRLRSRIPFAAGTALALLLCGVSLPVFLERQAGWTEVGRRMVRMVEPLEHDPFIASHPTWLWIPALPEKFFGDDHSGIYMAQPDDFGKMLQLRFGSKTDTRTWLRMTHAEGLDVEIRPAGEATYEVLLRQSSEAGFRDLVQWTRPLKTRRVRVTVEDVDESSRTVRTLWTFRSTLPGWTPLLLDYRDGQMHPMPPPWEPSAAAGLPQHQVPQVVLDEGGDELD